VSRDPLTPSSTTPPSTDFPFGDAIEVFVRREDAERSDEEVRGDEPELRGSRSGSSRPAA